MLTAHSWVQVLNTSNWLLHAAMAVVLVVAVVVFVRPGRPDVFPMALTGALLELTSTLGSLGQMILGLVGVGYLGHESFMELSAVVALGLGLLSSVGRGLVIYALVMLARPPRSLEPAMETSP